MPDSKPDRETRIRERAYKLWEENGRPDGRDADLWQQAEDLIAMEDKPDAGQLPISSGEHAEESEIQENYGETPAGSPTRVTARKHRVRATGRKGEIRDTSCVARKARRVLLAAASLCVPPLRVHDAL